MKFLTITELKKMKSLAIEKMLSIGPIVLIRKGKTIGIIKKPKEFPAKVQSLFTRLKKSATRAGYRLSDVDALIKDVRMKKGEK